jgi:hypothetical protein
MTEASLGEHEAVAENPVETLGGRHYTRLVPSATAGSGPHCPVCGTRGIPVTAAVMKNMVDRPHREALNGQNFRFCTAASCPIAYFDNRSAKYLDVQDVNKPITIKNPGPDVPVCYCLRVNRKTIIDAVFAGKVHSSEDAKRVTKACTGKACHIVNPAGTCCGDQLRDTVAAALAWNGAPPAEVAAARTEDPGATCCGRTLSRATAGDVDITGTASVHGESCCAIPVSRAENAP